MKNLFVASGNVPLAPPETSMRVKSGPLAGLEGQVVDSVIEADRVLLIVRNHDGVAVEIEAAYLEPAESPSQHMEPQLQTDRRTPHEAPSG